MDLYTVSSQANFENRTIPLTVSTSTDKRPSKFFNLGAIILHKSQEIIVMSEKMDDGGT